MIANGSLRKTEYSGIFPDISVSNNDDAAPDENAKLAEQLLKQRDKIVAKLSELPLTALWILTKHGHCSAANPDKPSRQCADLRLDSLRCVFLDCQRTASEQGLNSHSYKDQLRALRKQLLDTTFHGEDINGLSVLLLRQTAPSLLPEKASDIRTLIDKSQSKPELDRLMLFYEKQSPGFLCPANTLTSHFLSELISHYLHWARIRRQFAVRNQGLVRLLQQQYKGEVLNDEDLFQEGLIGLLKAIDRFDHRLGFKFSTYATYWIRQAMSRALTRGERTVRLPFAQMASINKLCQARESLLNQTGHEPSDQDLADELGWSVDAVGNLQNISQTALSLDESFSDDSHDNNTLLQFLPQDNRDSPLQQHSDQQLHQLFAQALSLLNAKERLIICWRFGFNGGSELTLDEIGKRLDLTRERVRQIQVMAMAKIKSHYGTQLQHFLA